MKRFAVVLALSLCLAAVAQAVPTVELILDVDEAAGTWQLLATATPATISGKTYEDSANGGIAGFNIVLSGIETGVMTAPDANDANGDGKRGFTIAGADLSIENQVAFAGQNSTEPDSLVYGVGQTAGSFDSYTLNPFTPFVESWDVPVVLYEGTFLGEVPTIVSGDATVWAAADDVATMAADVVIIPEPATLGLLAMGAVALIRRRR